jgi:hypothetical protein
MVLSGLSRLIISGDVAPGSLVLLTPEGDEIAILAGQPDEVNAEAVTIRAAQAATPPAATAAPVA